MCSVNIELRYRSLPKTQLSKVIKKGLSYKEFNILGDGNKGTKIEEKVACVSIIYSVDRRLQPPLVSDLYTFRTFN